jgi:hypothetical protein
MNKWRQRVRNLVIPTFVSTEQAMKWGSHLNAEQRATLVERQRALSNTALAECDLQRMVNLATQSQLMREAAEAFAPARSARLSFRKFKRFVKSMFRHVQTKMPV